MRTKLQKWGNSLAVRIPAAFVKETGLAYGAAVDLSLDGGKIVIESRSPPTFDLDALLRDVSRKNLHASLETGRPAGREAW